MKQAVASNSYAMYDFHTTWCAFHGAVERGAMCVSAVQCSASQCSAVQCSASHHSAVQCLVNQVPC